MYERELELRKAVLHRDLRGVRFILDGGGVDINLRGWGLAPLHLAAREGYPKIVEELIRAGADVNLRTSYHYSRQGGYCSGDDTALGLAITSDSGTPRHLRVVRALLRAGAGFYYWRSNSSRIVDYAIQNAQVGVVRALMDHSRAKHLRIEPPLHLAARLARYDVVRELVENHDFDPLALDTQMLTPLDLAAAYIPKSSGRLAKPRAYRAEHARLCKFLLKKYVELSKGALTDRKSVV